MPFYIHALGLAILLSLLPKFGLSVISNETVVGNPATALKPININDFEAATGVRRRSAEDFSHLDPSTQAQLIYGRPGNDGQLLLANMTLYAPDGLQIVMMERFEPLTNVVDCKGDDGEMSLTFKSQAAFDYAINTWSFINQAQDERFLLIANHAGCGPDDERQPYLITDIREDKARLTTYLTAHSAPWSDIAGTYDLDFGKAVMPQPSRHRRGLWDFVRHGDADFSKAVNFPVNVGTPGERNSIVDISKFTLACTDCYITGSFQFTGHLSVSGFKLQDFVLSGAPQDFAAKLQLETTITAPLGSPDSLQYAKELFSAPIPDAGISVTGIFSLGAVVSYEIGVSTSFAGSASMTFGLSTSLPNTAIVVADVRHPSQSSATGLDGGQVDQNFDLTALSASVTVAAFSQPKLSFGVEITKVGNLGIALGVKMPVISATLTGGYNESGLCSTAIGTSKTGVNLTSEVALEVNLELDAKLGEGEDQIPTEDQSTTTTTQHQPPQPEEEGTTPQTEESSGKDSQSGLPSLSYNLFKSSHPLLQKCIPLALPSLPAANGTTTTLPLNSTLISNSRKTSAVAISKTKTMMTTAVSSSAMAVETLVPVTTTGMVGR